MVTQRILFWHPIYDHCGSLCCLPPPHFIDLVKYFSVKYFSLSKVSDWHDKTRKNWNWTSSHNWLTAVSRCHWILLLQTNYASVFSGTTFVVRKTQECICIFNFFPFTNFHKLLIWIEDFKLVCCYRNMVQMVQILENGSYLKNCKVGAVSEVALLLISWVGVVSMIIEPLLQSLDWFLGQVSSSLPVQSSSRQFLAAGVFFSLISAGAGVTLSLSHWKEKNWIKKSSISDPYRGWIYCSYNRLLLLTQQRYFVPSRLLLGTKNTSLIKILIKATAARI